jgi:transposase InsO family protein
MRWILQEEGLPIRCLIHDRDATFPTSFDHVFATEHVRILRTPFRSPKANAFAERWVRSVREECLDHVLILSEQHLRRVLKEYTTYFNDARPHQGIAQAIPVGDRRGVTSVLCGVGRCWVASFTTSIARLHNAP